ncbi:3'(2'),5'-bisphosphate nucleotidase CysQ [Jongsikchunia kroppenstedtii]|uniref:3'(2'),5'-bisphosphate nucleotidase CysQ n=1 Tax=Jongsikchunia kroppenstedtii TaxID=1121721 RepID=UPI000364DB93|nr:3'(2'),5'-bisphosphate nucleotidase CysQ [Jongsikchunia kroppenstedtii]
MSTDIELAGELATAAGELLMTIRGEGLTGKELGKAGDQRSNAFLLERLAAERPDDRVLSEESSDDKRRLTADRVWIIDPLDGTREYGMGGRADWAVHVALWERGDLTVGAVALPALGPTYVSNAEPVAPQEGVAPPRNGMARVVVSGSRPPEFAQAVADALDGELTSVGSAGAKTMAVLRGEADAYVHAGGQYEWDSAAPVAVARAKGLWCSRIDGSPLIYNQDDVYLPDLVVCRPELAEKVLATIAG